MKLLSLSDVDDNRQAHQEQPTMGSSRVAFQPPCLALQFDPLHIWSLQFKCPGLRGQHGSILEDAVQTSGTWDLKVDGTGHFHRPRAPCHLVEDTVSPGSSSVLENKAEPSVSRPN